MQYYSKIQLKNGKVCTLRSPGANDAVSILEVMRKTSGETDFMLRYPDEIKMTVDAESKYLSDIEASDNSIMICASVDGTIIANAGITPVASAEKCRHRGEFGISIQQEFCGLGIGSNIISAILEEAKHAGYEQVELDVVRENVRAMGLYKKYGFVEYGCKEKAFKCRDGSYQDLILMVCKL